MEQTENTEVKQNNKGQFEAKDENLLQRAVTMRHYLKRGYHCKEICARMQISNGQYRYALKWMAREFKTNNSEAFAAFQLGEQARLDEIEMDIQTARTKEDLRAVATLHKVAAEVRRGIMDMALKLGVLQRETIRIEARRVDVCFGDEEIVPWYAVEEQKKPEQTVTQECGKPN